MKIALIGYGKMGRAIEEIALQKGHEIVLKISIDNIEELTTENLQQADVAIEFTGPESAVNNLSACFDAGLPVVCGSTGWLNNWDEMIALCHQKNSGLLYASNFSIGVNIFFELNTYLAKMMNNYNSYDAQLTEVHHTEKKDAPSGTAITLANQIIEQFTHKKRWVNTPTENDEELQIISQRIDPAPGIHKVLYTSPIDDIEIIHTAHNRKGFAAGAVLAAEFMAGKKGVYSMKDVLGF